MQAIRFSARRLVATCMIKVHPATAFMEGAGIQGGSRHDSHLDFAPLSSHRHRASCQFAHPHRIFVGPEPVAPGRRRGDDLPGLDLRGGATLRRWGMSSRLDIARRTATRSIRSLYELRAGGLEVLHPRNGNLHTGSRSSRQLFDGIRRDVWCNNGEVCNHVDDHKGLRSRGMLNSFGPETPVRSDAAGGFILLCQRMALDADMSTHTGQTK